MGVIQYRRGERFDRVIVNPRERAGGRDSSVITLNTLTHGANKVRQQAAPPAPSLIQDQADKLSATLQGQVGELLKMRHLPASTTPNADPDRTAELKEQAVRYAKANPMRAVIFAIIAVQLLRACFGD